MQVMSSAGAPRPPFNPRTDMDNKISSAVEAGSISETDAAALESALDSIDSTLGSSSTGSADRLDPSQMKARIDSLISDQVDAGTLTEEQAAQLQDLFAQGPSQAGGPPPEMAASTEGSTVAGVEGTAGLQGMGGPGGPQGPGGPPPPPPPSGDESNTSASDDTDTSADALLSSIQAFVENLRAGLAANATYTTSTSGTARSTSGLIVDQLA
ncbi:hypothetical protein SAMN05518801_106137 [Novosphingobium sp. CF614]|uniref:hypothetical protein n=1 Tax=Novosphingobium sp. CF614 TaxID=1884364 RepID=UPI0008E62307|nr:hypothetical protein [Novosphingobium sp. CF614]SFG05121.1 hypothetical protein SAMN05518801_106137 [Novosphingobium sp. CF614]